MNLFDTSFCADTNLLPIDGTVNYYGKLLLVTKADAYFHSLLNDIVWKHDEAIIFGKHITTKRKVAWYGDKEYSYTYSNIRHDALLWTPQLIELKNMVEGKTGLKFNSCLLNLYHDESDGMAWHSDDEKALGKDTAIASLSFGAERKFSFKHKRTKEIVSLTLEHGSLLVMKDETQTNWLHTVPKTKRVKSPRINLTFRTMLT